LVSTVQIFIYFNGYQDQLPTNDWLPCTSPDHPSADDGIAQLYRYICALRDGQGGFLEDYGDLQVELYAYNRKELVFFLRTSNSYNLEKARTICEGKKYMQELVFIFSRMGDIKRALHLIIEELEDVEIAVEFVQTVRDQGLQTDLVEQAKTKLRTAPPPQHVWQ
jgi:hypothetical protein